MDRETQFYVVLRYVIMVVAIALLVAIVGGIHACYVDARTLQRACVERGGIYTDLHLGENDFRSGCYRMTITNADSVKAR